MDQEACRLLKRNGINPIIKPRGMLEQTEILLKDMYKPPCSKHLGRMVE
jgi:hypothetical protein